MAPSLPASSRSFRDTRPRAAVHQRPSGRSRSPRNDPSTITSPAKRPSTQISPGIRGTNKPTRPATPHNHSPPSLTEAPIQISNSARLPPLLRISGGRLRAARHRGGVLDADFRYSSQAIAASASDRRCCFCLVATAAALELPPVASAHAPTSCLRTRKWRSRPSGASVGRPLRKVSGNSQHMLAVLAGAPSSPVAASSCSARLRTFASSSSVAVARNVG
jgi:hypothetical protein